jgi:hypothetical protein
MKIETVVQPMLPLQACAHFAETKEDLAKAYLEILSAVDWSLNPELRCDSLCVLDALHEDISGGGDIADGFVQGHPCERGFVFLLDSLTPAQLTQFVYKVHARRLNPAELQHGGSSKDFLAVVPRLIMDSFISARRSLRRSAIERNLGETLLTWREAHSSQSELAETLLYLTAWGNKPPHEGPLRCKPSSPWEALQPEPAHFFTKNTCRNCSDCCPPKDE